MRRATLLALGLTMVCICSQDGATAQTSATPPLSLTPPKASPPRAGMKNSAATSARVPSTAPASGLPQLPGPAPATDYDGFSAGTDDSDAPSQVTPPAKSRAANGSGLDAQSLVDREDEALKRKLTICQKCK